MRWVFPGSLLVVEYLTLSLLVDFPTSGPAMRFVSLARMLVPAVIGGGAAGWLIARRGVPPSGDEAAVAESPWRAWLAAGAQLVAFAGTAWLAVRLFGPGRTVGAGAFVAWLGCAAATALLALTIAAPAGTLLRAASAHLRVPLLAIAVGLLSWRAVDAAEGLWGVLRSGTLRAVAGVLGAVATDVVVDPSRSLVGAGGFDVLVAPVCSGVDGLGLVVVFQAVWLSFARSRVRLGRALFLLVPLGAAAAIAANVARISVLILLGASGREDLAMGAFHSKLGWMLFVGVALASVAAVEHVPWVRSAEQADGADTHPGVPRAAGAYVAPLVASLAVAVLTSLWTAPGLDRAYGLRLVAAGAVLLAVRRSLPAPSVSPSPVPVLLGATVAMAWIAARGPLPMPGAALAVLGPVERDAWIATRLLGACVVLPVVEELAFRGFLLPWLVDAEFERVSPRAWTGTAVLLSSVAFGAIHESWILGTLAGLAFAAARRWRGRLSDAIVAHAVANAGVAVAALVGGRWDLWS